MRKEAVLVLAAMVALAGCGIHTSSSSEACNNDKCNVTITTATEYQVILFGDLDVTAASISASTVSITVGADSDTLGPGQTAVVGGHKVTIAQLNGSSHTVKFTVYD
jgi:hypothetical protein